MKYQFTFRNTAADLWLLSMYYIYGSLAGACNLIFTAAVLVLAVSKWQTFSPFFQVVLVLACCLFTVFQPLAVYRKAKRQAAGIQNDTWMGFDDKTIYIRVGDQSSQIPWTSIKKISKKPSMLVIFSDTTHGFVLTNRTLGADRDEFYRFVMSRIPQR